jgi:hypothetical protein
LVLGRLGRSRHLTKVVTEGARPVATSESIDFGHGAFHIVRLSGQGGLNRSRSSLAF